MVNPLLGLWFLKHEKSHFHAMYTPLSTPKAKKQAGFDFQMMKRLYRILQILFTNRLLIIIYLCLIVTSVIYQIIAYFIGTWIAEFYSVIPKQKPSDFQQLIMIVSLLILAIAASKACILVSGSYFGLKSRKQLVEFCMNKYLESRNVYSILNFSELHSIDNPDQRMTQDIDNFSNSISYILEQIVISPLLMIYYIYQTALVGGWSGPVFLILYFIVACILSRCIIQPISKLVFLKEQKEGVFECFY